MPLHPHHVSNPWVHSTKLVVKPDQLIKRRGKAGLLLLNATWEDVKAWVAARIGTEVTIESVTGVLDVFIVEPFTPHGASDEYYICMQSHRFGEEILFHHEVHACMRVGCLDGSPVQACASTGQASVRELAHAL